MADFRMGVVGLGHRGRAMFQWVAKGIDGVKAVAACDLNADLFYKDVHFYYGGHKPPIADEMPDVRFYDQYDEMLDQEELDIIMVETPATCHAEFCAKALEKGIHVYSDIPSVASLSEAKMLWEVQSASTAMLMTGATTCGWGFVLAMQDLARQGLLGKPYYLEAEYIHDCRPLWEESPWRKPGKGNHRYPITYCTHSLGPLLSILDEVPRHVTCLSTGSHITDIPEAEDLMVALYQTDSGVLIRQTNSFINQCTTGHHSFRIFGSKGYFEHLSQRGSQPARTAFSSRKLYGMDKWTEIPIGFTAKEVEIRSQQNTAAMFGHGGADSFLWHRFVEALQNKEKEAPINLKKGLAMTLPGIYAQASAERGGVKMPISYPWDEDFKTEI